MSNATKPPAKTLTIDGHKIVIGHPDRVYFPDAGYTKMQTLSYYARVAPLMAQRTKSRPIVLRRYPEEISKDGFLADGIGKQGFFQKRVGSYYPDWIPRAVQPISNGTLEYALGGEAAALVWLANLGTIEFHAMLNRADRPNRPDQIIFDLDPPIDYSDGVRLAALGLKAICDDLGLTAFVKSTGSRGFHVIVPIARYYDFDQTRSFAKLLATRLMQKQPGKLSLDMRKASREKRILVDVWRNGYGQTAVAPFSLRARPGAPVAVPLKWSDLQSPEIHPRAVTLGNFAEHEARARCAWPAKLGPSGRIEKAWRALGGESLRA